MCVHVQDDHSSLPELHTECKEALAQVSWLAAIACVSFLAVVETISQKWFSVFLLCPLLKIVFLFFYYFTMNTVSLTNLCLRQGVDFGC